MDNVLPSTVTYQVKALVNNIPLDECTLVSSRDSVQPYFVNSIVDDPDVTGLIILLRNSKGETTDIKIHYSLESGQKPEQEKTAAGHTEQTTGPGLKEEEGEEKEAAETNTSTNSGVDAVPKEPEIKSDETKETTELEKTAETDELNKSSEQIEKPEYAEKPEDIEAVSYAESEDETLYDEKENPADNEVTVNVHLVEQEMVFKVEQLDKDLPPFRLPKKLPHGIYTFVFQVIGKNRNLQQIEKTFYYLSDIDFSFRDIQMYLPSFTAASRIIPKSTNVMLEARLIYDRTLDPYIIWYHGRKIISEGSFSDGAERILWKAPEQNGFMSLRAEIYPVQARQGLTGTSREISLPVSTKASIQNILAADSPGLLHWYLFEGELGDSKAPLTEERILAPLNKNEPQWMPVGGGYGLVTGPRNVFVLPTVSLSGDETDRGQFLFRFRPVADGSIFNAKFVSSENIEMNLYLENDFLVLSLASPLEIVSETIGPIIRNTNITATIDFAILPELLEAKLGVEGIIIQQEENEEQSEEEGEEEEEEEIVEKNIAIEAELSGEIKVSLGATLEQRTTTFSDERDGQNKQTVTAGNTSTAIWDEFALLNMPYIERAPSTRRQPPSDEQPASSEQEPSE
ncbi:MAG: hypothetical protein FWG99_09750 [Treponema sp.]|nr:hypothetical protein [Treponema sp.]